MKKLSSIAVVTLCMVVASAAQSIAKYGAFNTSCSAVTTTGVCSYFSMPLFSGYTVPSEFTWQVLTVGSPSAISITLEGSVDGRTSLDGVATASSTTFTSASLKFVAADAGKTVYIGGAKTGGLTFATTIASVTNPTTVVLNAAPNLSIVGAPTFVGTFQALDTSTNTAGEIRVVVNNPMLYLRTNLGTLTGGTSVTAGFTVKGQ